MDVLNISLESQLQELCLLRINDQSLLEERKILAVLFEVLVGNDIVRNYHLSKPSGNNWRILPDQMEVFLFKFTLARQRVLPSHKETRRNPPSLQDLVWHLALLLVNGSLETWDILMLARLDVVLSFLCCEFSHYRQHIGVDHNCSSILSPILLHTLDRSNGFFVNVQGQEDRFSHTWDKDYLNT